MRIKIRWVLPLFLLLLATLWWFNRSDRLPIPTNSSQIVTVPAQSSATDESQGEQQKLAPLTRLGKGRSIDIALDPTHQHIVITTATGVYLYDRETFTQRNFMETDAPVQAVTFSPSGATVIFTTMGSNRQLYQWQLPDDQLTSYPLDKSLTHGLAFSPDGGLFGGNVL